jgi:hypothetical protein
LLLFAWRRLARKMLSPACQHVTVSARLTLAGPSTSLAQLFLLLFPLLPFLCPSYNLALTSCAISGLLSKAYLLSYGSTCTSRNSRLSKSKFSTYWIQIWKLSAEPYSDPSSPPSLTWKSNNSHGLLKPQCAKNKTPLCTISLAAELLPS